MRPISRSRFARYFSGCSMNDSGGRFERRVGKMAGSARGQVVRPFNRR
jgi:hypothetical protein